MTTPISPRRTELPATERGFTLVEMLVVVAIIALVGAIAISRLSEAPRVGDRARIVTLARGALSDAREQAMTAGVPTAPAMADAAAAKLTIFTGPASGMPLLFYADGSSTGGTVAIADRATLSVDWLTGEISDVG